MRLDQPLLKLPISFCAESLADEVRALPVSAWHPHPTGFAGNEAVLLVTPGGEMDQGIEGEMGPTEHLLSCSYIMQVMRELGGVWGRSRLMGLAPGAEVPAHVDINYYWRTHLRIHIPVITNPGVRFTCGDQTVHMAAGECWVFDSFRWHDVQNRGSERRIHLVLDTVGGGMVWDLVRRAQSDAGERLDPPASGVASTDELKFEKTNVPEIMSPWEIRCHIGFILEHTVPAPCLAGVAGRLERFADDWAAVWARFGASREGIAEYALVLRETRRDLNSLGVASLMLGNELQQVLALEQMIFQMVLPPPAPPASLAATAAGSGTRLAS
jgi:hypothetical protein